MRGFTPSESFGPDVASHYDDEPRGDEQAAVDFLADLAGDGTALELAIGTGRIALPLTDKGVPVDGIELSRAMVDRLRAKPGGEALHVTLGDMSTVGTGKTYRVVYLVFNTVFNLLTQDDQVACFENAARHLSEDGAFLVEAAVPSSSLSSHSYARPEDVQAQAVTLDVCTYDPVTQILDENHVRISQDEGIRFGPISCRLAWPSELDLMARLAGLRLEQRWGGWQRQPYTGTDAHVSVYRRA
jgi:hypothetical protein